MAVSKASRQQLQETGPNFSLLVHMLPEMTATPLVWPSTNGVTSVNSSVCGVHHSTRGICRMSALLQALSIEHCTDFQSAMRAHRPTTLPSACLAGLEACMPQSGLLAT